MKLSNTFITLSIGLVAAGPLAIRNPQKSGIPFGANGLLGRAGANGSPQAPNCGAGKVLLDGECVNQSQSPEPSCDCSKPFRSLGSGGFCDDGYENTSFFFGAGKDCTQLNCPEEEFNTQCDAKLQDAKPAAVAESPTPTAANEQKTCDCYKPFQVPAFDGDSCRAGYEDIAFISIPECVQIGCSAQDYKAQCDAKPQVADESSDDCPPAVCSRIPGCEHIAAANGCQVCPPGCALGGAPIEEAAEADDEPNDGCPLPFCNRFPGCEPIMGANGCMVCPTGC